MTVAAPFDRETLFAAIDVTWPPAGISRLGPWLLRRGAGGGHRVSCATATGTVTPAEIDAAEEAMQLAGGPVLFRIHPADAGLDAQLAARGYAVAHRSCVLHAPAAEIAAHAPSDPTDAILCDGALAILREIWFDGGLGPERIAVMDRVAAPARAVLGRHRERPAGAAFVALAGRIALVHALHIRSEARRAGLGRKIIGQAASWARDMGAESLIALTLRENTPAMRLFSGIGMQLVENYHYRTREPTVREQ